MILPPSSIDRCGAGVVIANGFKRGRELFGCIGKTEIHAHIGERTVKDMGVRVHQPRNEKAWTYIHNLRFSTDQILHAVARTHVNNLPPFHRDGFSPRGIRFSRKDFPSFKHPIRCGLALTLIAACNNEPEGQDQQGK